mmetsp:Transcript_51619/g.125909  ORF Transcript_51619/g.125909 Transcript_51619/m.125909 type:complete len:283 (-) Transcript_51619:5468-6316(-)
MIVNQIQIIDQQAPVNLARSMIPLLPRNTQIPVQLHSKNPDDEKKEQQQRAKVAHGIERPDESPHELLQPLCGFEDPKCPQNPEDPENSQNAQNSWVQGEGRPLKVHGNAEERYHDDDEIELVPSRLKVLLWIQPGQLRYNLRAENEVEDEVRSRQESLLTNALLVGLTGHHNDIEHNESSYGDVELVHRHNLEDDAANTVHGLLKACCRRRAPFACNAALSRQGLGFARDGLKRVDENTNEELDHEKGPDHHESEEVQRQSRVGVHIGTRISPCCIRGSVH